LAVRLALAGEAWVSLVFGCPWFFMGVLGFLLALAGDCGWERWLAKRLWIWDWYLAN
jgi:hypothetical protein